MLVKKKIVGQTGFLRDVIIGCGDGLTVSFAVVAGLTVVIPDSRLILLVGLLVILVQSIAMGISGWLSAKSEQTYYYHEIHKIDHPEEAGEIERQELLDFYNSMDFPDEMRRPALAEIDHGNRQWVEFLRRFDLGPAQPGSGATTKSALNIGISYAVGGIIPLLPYFFYGTTSQAIVYAILLTLAGLFALGFYKSKLTGATPFSMAVNVMVTGAVAAACTYLVALFFR